MLILSNELTIRANVNLVGGHFDSSWTIGQVRIICINPSYRSTCRKDAMLTIPYLI